jgi:hypothetical protein
MPTPTQAQAAQVAAYAVQLARAYRTFRFPDRELASDSAIEPRGPFADLAAPKTASIDWRTKLQLAQPGQQGTCNACTSFAVATAIEICWLIAHPNQPVHVSPGYLHTCIGHRNDTDPAQICRDGIDLSRMLLQVQEQGYASAAPGDYPFDPGICPNTPLAGNISGAQEIAGPNEAKQHLLKGPIVADMYVWPDFFRYTTNDAPAYTPNQGSGSRFLHSVCVIGFGPAGWLIRNSYGPNWGDGTGHAIIPYRASPTGNARSSGHLLLRAAYHGNLLRFGFEEILRSESDSPLSITTI